MFWWQHAVAQRPLKYKEVYQILKTKSKEEAYMSLQEFQHQNPQHANVYFQLGKITEYYSKLFDPMIYPSLVEYFTYETKNYLGLAKHYINDKEVRKNRNYYEKVKILDGAKKISLIDVQHDIDQRISDNKKYAENVKLISFYFQRSTYFYKKCIQNFREINLSEPKIKDLYLMADDSLKSKLKYLKADFDSTLYYITEYQNALTNYPLKNYHPEYTLKPIETFRLEGLTNVSFLYNLFYIWDFGKWVNDFNKVVEKEIVPLRAKINTANNNLDIALKTTLKLASHSDSLQMYHPADALLNQISKYDFASPIVALFQYKKTKIDFLLTANNSLLDKEIYNPEIPELASVKKFNELVNQYAELNQKLKDIERLSSSKELEKYNNFIIKNFQNFQGFKNYLNKEGVENEKLIQGISENYKILIQRLDTRYFYQNKYIPFAKDSIPLFYNTSDSTAKFVADCFVTWKNTQIVGGIINSEKSSQKFGFVAALYKGKTVWTKSLKSGRKESIHTQCVTLGDNIIYAIGQTAEKAYFVSYDVDGKATNLFEKGFSGKILHFSYDDIAQSFLLISQSVTSDSLQIQRLGLVGEDLWETPLNIPFKGTFVNSTKFGNEYYVLVNAQGAYFLKDNQFEFRMGNKWQPTILVFNNEGKAIKVKSLELGTNVIAQKIQKLNSALLDIIGYYGSLDNKENRVFYFLLDKDLNTLKKL